MLPFVRLESLCWPITCWYAVTKLLNHAIGRVSIYTNSLWLVAHHVSCVTRVHLDSGHVKLARLRECYALTCDGDWLQQCSALASVLCWLPMPQRRQFKIALLAFKCIQGVGPSYFQHVCILTSNLCGRDGLCSAECGDLAVPRTATELRKQSFSIAAAVT